MPRPRPARPAERRPLPPLDPVIRDLLAAAAALNKAGLSYRAIAAGAQIPQSTLSDLVAGRRIHLTVADARSLARYLHHDLVLNKVLASSPDPR